MAQVHGAGNGIPVLDAAQYNCLLRYWMLNIYLFIHFRGSSMPRKMPHILYGKHSLKCRVFYKGNTVLNAEMKKGTAKI